METAVPMLGHNSNEMLNQKIAGEIITCCQKRNEPITVLIDGKAASGKSTMAEVLKDILEKHNQPVCIIEADWFLKARDYRIAELKKIIETGNVYINSHLLFWDWNELKRQMQIVHDQALTGGQVTLRNLYIRGESNTIKELIIPQNTVILVPGSYLLSQNIEFDLAIMLYVNREEGRRRKMNREYQKKKTGFFPNLEAMGTIILSWELLEEPTFLYHMVKYGDKAQIIVDTSGPGHSNIIKYEMYQTKSFGEMELLNTDIVNFVYKQSEVGEQILRLMQNGKPGEVKVSDGEQTLTVRI